MGVYIKGIKMPKNCKECIFFLERYDEDGEYLSPICMPTQLRYEVGCALNRASYCPLVEVSEPHGRLIDADKVVSYVPGDEAPLSKYLMAKAMLSVPTVIERSEL